MTRPPRSKAESPLTGLAVSGIEAARARSAALAWNVRKRVPKLLLLRWREGDSQVETLRGIEYRRGTRWRTGL
jgi:hypothetical protein